MRPSPDDIIASLDHIYLAMQVAEELMMEAQTTHRRAFDGQMRDAMGLAAIVLPAEPYLDAVIAQHQLWYVQRLEKLFNRVHDLYLPPRKSFSLLKPITPQVERQVALESVRTQRELMQSLDIQRQRAFGVRRYIWRSQDDDKVRAAHAANDDRIFSYGDAPPTGHPGEAYGCRCWAEPITQGADDPAGEEFDVAIAPAVAAQQIIAIINAADKARKAAAVAAGAAAGDVLLNEEPGEQESEEDKPAGNGNSPEGGNEEPPEDDSQSINPLDVLNPNGTPIGEKGNHSKIRIVKGGEKAARELYDKLSKGGKSRTPEQYPGEGTELSNGDWVGYRPKSKNGEPAIDIKIRGFPYTKIKFP